MALVRCLGCGLQFEFNGVRVACPSCGTVMRISAAPPPGVSGRGEAQAELELPPGVTPAAPVGSGESWLNDTARMWIWIVVGVLGFVLFIDWFRMKITPVKKVVDQAKVEQLAHDLAQERIGELQSQLEKAQAVNAKPPAADGNLVPQQALQPQQPQPVVVTDGTTVAPVRAVAPKAASVVAATGPVVRNPAYAGYAGLAMARPKNIADAGVTDGEIEGALKKGVNWMAGQFTQHRLKNVEGYEARIYPGADAISVYSLLVAGQSVGDERVRGATPVAKDLIEGLKELQMEGGTDTYARSLRISALGVLNRKEDRATIDADARWLLDSSMQGAFYYSKPATPQLRSSGGWDNSNSQYGGLGLWAASEAGVRVPNAFWKDVENHWTDSQVKMSGGWAYTGSAGPASLSMTCAGATMLMLARDLVTVEGASANVTAPLSRPLARALEWLDEGEHTLDVGSSGHYGYTLFGLERVGLASGYKFFGKHDWYRELAKKAVGSQQADGSWTGGDTVASETAFHLLFLARGREPVFMGKLRWDGNWSNRPRDVATLTRFAGKTLERALNWQVLGLQRDWREWTDAPVLLITSEDAPKLSDDDVAKLRAYALAGGLIFTHAENGNAGFNGFAADLAKRAFPEYAMEKLPETHGIYSAMIPMQTPPLLSGVSNGSRLLMVHSPGDLTKQWGTKMGGATERARPTASEMGVNVVVWATGRRDLRRRTDSAYVAERAERPVGVIPVARLRYEGNWDPEPWGWVRVARTFDRETSVGLDVRVVDLVALEPGTAPVAHLTGTAARTFTDAEVKVVRDYVNGGGVLLIDSCGGSPAFGDSVREGIVSRAFAGATASVVGAGHPVMGKGQAWMGEIPQLLTRGETKQARGLQVISAGKGAVVFTDLDLSTGLLGTTVSGVRGYEPGVAERLVENLVVWAVWPEGAPKEVEVKKE